jgi:hypothetical protein
MPDDPARFRQAGKLLGLFFAVVTVCLVFQAYWDASYRAALAGVGCAVLFGAGMEAGRRAEMLEVLRRIEALERRGREVEEARDTEPRPPVV